MFNWFMGPKKSFSGSYLMLTLHKHKWVDLRWTISSEKAGRQQFQGYPKLTHLTETSPNVLKLHRMVCFEVLGI